MKELARKGQDHSWETYIARPSMVLSKRPGFLSRVAGWILGAVQVDHLAIAMLDMVSNGSAQDTFENADLLKKGAQVMRERN